MKFNRILLFYAVAATFVAVGLARRYGVETRRLGENQAALASRVEHFRTRAGEEAAAAQVLRLRCAEFEALRAEDAARIREQGIRLRRLESAARAAMRTQVEVRAPLRDTVFIRLYDTVAVRDTVRLFRWRDAWVEVEGRIGADSVACRVESVDTLRQVVHRIPRRFLFIRWGTKALRQEITSTNPHTRIVHTEYVKIER